jgi:hypothetical protein
VNSEILEEEGSNPFTRKMRSLGLFDSSGSIKSALIRKDQCLFLCEDSNCRHHSQILRKISVKYESTLKLLTMYKNLTVRIEKILFDNAMKKCKKKFGISLSALIKVFLVSFTSQKGVGFYVGDDDICQLFERWLLKKQSQMSNPDGFVMPRPRLYDLYDLGNKKTRAKFDQFGT